MRRVWLASLLLAGVSCARPMDSPPEATEAAADSLCQEHGVLTAVCPKCNPALAAVFQAKGDWCEEHGFPESFCPICHPDRGGRPVPNKAAGPGDGAPADRTKIRFKTRETARLAGIETVPAVAATREENVLAVARVVYDASLRGVVGAPVPGVISEIRADLGSRVRRGDALATIQAPTVGAARSQWEAARSRAATEARTLERKRSLFNAGIVSAMDLQQAEQGVAAADADLAVLGAQIGLVEGAGAGNVAGYTLIAPLAGEVTRRGASVGMVVEGGAELFEIVDTSRMWVELDVPEADLPRIRVGTQATIVLDTLPDREFQGPVAYIAPAISDQTRTALVRVPLVNADHTLRANMYGTGRLAVIEARPTVTVPSSAVQRVQGVDFVFVRLAVDSFEARRVSAWSRDGDEVRLSGGLDAGETVVTRGSFMLKTETMKGSIGAGCCDGD